MAELGRVNRLKIIRTVEFGVYLDAQNLGEILMPIRYVPSGSKEGDEVEVFISLDSEDRLIATTDKPVAMVGEFGYMEVVGESQYGAFVDWGLMKDLFVPFREQKLKMEQGRSYLIRVYIDKETNRIAGSGRIERFLDNTPPDFEVGQEVDLYIYSESEMGFSAIINNTHTGILYHSELFKVVRKGMRTKGFIKKIREDDKIDLSLEPIGYKKKIDDLSQRVLDALAKSNGFLALSDKTDPDVIYNALDMSKKNFKKSIGSLFKAGLITISDEGIKLK
jgi:predicted RNA-binding protein (virulence factor B family)